MIELIKLASRSRRTAALLLILGVLSGACGAGLIWLISVILSRELPAATYLFGALALVALLARIAFISLLGRVHQGAVFALRKDLTRRILATPLRTLEDTGAARLQAALTADVLVLSEGFRLLPSFFINLTSALGCLVYLAWLSVPVFLAMLGFGALGVLSYWIPTQGAVRVSERAREREDDLFEHIRSLTDGIKELGLHRQRRTAFLAECLDPTADDLRRLSVRTNDIYGATASWGLFLFFLLIGLVLFVLPRVADVSDRTLMGYVVAILYFQQPLSIILEVLPIVNRGGVALRRIRLLGLWPAAPDAAPDAIPVLDELSGRHGESHRRLFRRLQLRGVTHTYHREQEDDHFLLGPIDLTLERGELVFLIGGNGSGKTTLAKLITGLYTPERGEIRLDGDVVTHDNREAYRQQFSAVFSDFHLFDSLLGAPSDPATRARIQRYLVRLHLDRKITITDGRFSTTRLSHGQRKRLALLAAYIEDRPFYVFDEWAADQDPAFKAVFYEQLLPDLKRLGKAVIVITHDDRYFHAADRILRLESGQLITPAGDRSPASSQEQSCQSRPGI
jgi:putative ATP-binding cassette transporter